VRNLERAGVSRSAAMAMTGHLTESVYRRYAVVDETMLKGAAAKLSTNVHSLGSGFRRFVKAESKQTQGGERRWLKKG